MVTCTKEITVFEKDFVINNIEIGDCVHIRKWKMMHGKKSITTSENVLITHHGKNGFVVRSLRRHSEYKIEDYGITWVMGPIVNSCA